MLTITRDEIAAELRLTDTRHAARRIRVLVERHGFPRPLPGSTTLFSRHLVALWFRTNGLGVAPAAAANDAAADAVAAHRHHLELKLGIAPL